LKAQLADFLNDLHVLRRLREGGYDAVQVRDKPLTAVVALNAARAAKLPFYYWMSFPISESKLRLAQDLGPRAGLLRWLSWLVRGGLGVQLLYRWVLPRADHVFVQSEQMKLDVAAKGINPHKLQPVPMAVDSQRFVGFERRVGQAFGDRRVVAYLGVCSRVRRIDFLLDVVALLRARIPDILLLLVGDADEEEERLALRAQIDAKELSDHVIVTGWLTPEQAQSRMAAAEVALALMAPDPLLDSTSPTKLVEYLAMGIPVVANDHPEQRRVIAESGAGLCTPFEAAAFAGAVEHILASPQDAKAMAARGGPWAARMRSYAVVAEAVARTYRTLDGSPEIRVAS
jgi:glycosyltransferase involved in cell wall biosynthesis